MVITPRLSDEALLDRIHASAKEYSNLIGKSYLIIGKNRHSPYFWFECKFEKKNFMHLMGIKSITLNPDAFFDASLAGCNKEGGISMSDCTPSRNHGRTTITEKSSCGEDLFRLKNAKYMKIGIKDRITQMADFDYVYGNAAILGFKKYRDNLPFPITLTPKSIDDFSTQKYRIIFIMEKDISDSLYKNIYVEIKDGLFAQLAPEFPEDLTEKIIFESDSEE